ncbi:MULTISPECIES: copper resistance system multicopper oxidase [unclassified Wenzhouxiangella]|uniref:copper resistance system multicopper oxidase n=1 Tax=unclassified Wenzhouxiangella TaxID=2613841 RepID=UPI000E32C7ED|nr:MULTISPECIES: copper resistance system multicopper oxidase [unclassified Wenzhouxiangella]RFF26969.1 copper resistance system multicopper oxidase [Wenzhouxiangella sp. 15181]RFP69481.1 copper resistance system multicopper oxidase [Wenzhouxiangella sp. 15190]
MKDDRKGFSKKSLSRRDFLYTTCLVSTGAFLPSFTPLWAGRQATENAGEFGELNATDAGGIDLYLERKNLLIGGRPGRAIAINGSIPGPVIRMQEGKEALIRVHNRLEESTSIHWHGILLPFDMDGVPGISFPGIPAGETFTYRYPIRQNGTYWYHSHTGLQEQLGHYGQLIVEPAEPDPVDYDVEHSIVLSDWTFEEPHRVLRKLKTLEGYYNFQRPTLANIDDQMKATGMSLSEVLEKRLAWDRMRMDPTDIADITGATYTFLMNGKAAHENPTFIARPGQRVRLRLVNASTMTFYDIRIPGLPMTVVQADGQNIRPVETDELRIAVAETYDVIVTLPDERAYTLFAETMDRSGYARGTLAPRQGMSAAVPEQRRRPMLTMADMGMMMHGDMDGMNGMKDESHEAMGHDMPNHASGNGHGKELPTTNLIQSIEHGPDKHGPASITMGQMAYRRLDYPGAGLGDDDWRVLTYSQLRALEKPYDRRPPTRQFDLHLTGNMHKYVWGFDGKKWSESDMIRFQYGERLRINMINDTMMSHPIHLHGMWMDLYAGAENYGDNPRKHTVIVQPSELLTVDISVDAPGQWAFHCHLLYHMEAGMFRTVAVVRSLDGGPIDVKA